MVNNLVGMKKKLFLFCMWILFLIVEIEAVYKDEIHAQEFNDDSKGKFVIINTVEC